MTRPGLNGVFVFDFPRSVVERCKIAPHLEIPNMVVSQGREQFLRGICANESMGLTGGPPTNFHLGLCNQTPDLADTLVDLTTELTAAGGYARQAITRDSVGWPTFDTVSGINRARSKILTFTASGADFSGAFSRAFLCSVASGTVGNLFAVSGALTVPVTLLNGESFQLRYELYFN